MCHFWAPFFPSLEEALGAWVCTVMPRQCLLRGWCVLAQAYDNDDLGKETSGAQSESEVSLVVKSQDILTSTDDFGLDGKVFVFFGFFFFSVKGFSFVFCFVWMHALMLCVLKSDISFLMLFLIKWKDNLYTINCIHF